MSLSVHSKQSARESMDELPAVSACWQSITRYKYIFTKLPFADGIWFWINELEIKVSPQFDVVEIVNPIIKLIPFLHQVFFTCQQGWVYHKEKTVANCKCAYISCRIYLLIMCIMFITKQQMDYSGRKSGPICRNYVGWACQVKNAIYSHFFLNKKISTTVSFDWMLIRLWITFIT